MARPREPIDIIIAKGKKHLTKSEITERREQEINIAPCVPDVPEYLPEKLHAKFLRTAKLLAAHGLMTELDADCLARYLIEEAEYISLSSRVAHAISRGDALRAAELSAIKNKAFSNCQSCAAVLGMTISSRAKLVLPKKDCEKPANKFLSIPFAGNELCIPTILGRAKDA